MAGPASNTTARTLAAEALAHHREGRLGAAEASYRAALALAPAAAAIRHNLGVVIAAAGRPEEALACFDAVIAAAPDYAAAHYNRAVALAGLGRDRDALDGFGRTCALEPEHYEAHRAAGFVWLAAGNRGRALDHFARTFELRRGEDRSAIAQRSLTWATASKLRHDAAQLRYLSTRHRDGQRFELLARAYERVAEGFGDGAQQLTGTEHAALDWGFNTAIHVASAPEIAGSPIDPGLDAARITRAFFVTGEVANSATAMGHAVAFDRLLTPAALAALRRNLLESTIWHDFDHIGGFVASYLEDGLASPLLLQIADEMRRRFPAILADHPLSQAWAFKGLAPDAAIDAHADDAAVSLNFWITPDAANLAPGTGGLRVCRAAPPADHAITGYDDDHAATAAFIDRHPAETLVVPYAENRAVLFQSRLFHRSDAPHFAAGYENHRINVTMLFGRHA